MMGNATNSLKAFTLICLLLLIILYLQGDNFGTVEIPTPKQAETIIISSRLDEIRRKEKELFIPLKAITQEESKLKKILVWHFADREPVLNYGYGQAPFIYDHCEENRCYLTDDKDLLPVTEYDAVIFHFRLLTSVTLPSERLPYQRWIFYETESPSYLYDDPKIFNGLFNWTMTYRSDSDIVKRYGYVEKIKTNSGTESKQFHNEVLPKPKMAAWLVSNCRSLSYRESIVEQLQKKIQVDIYGKCGSFSCEPVRSENCYRMIERNYKFYLSFENSYCKDYVTEKLYNILRHRIVPVVYGNANYAEIAPPHSFIDVRKFGSFEGLADYLIYLSRNDTAYNEYFKWKNSYRIVTWRERIASAFCSLCKKLHTDQHTKTYTDIEDWFVNKGKCTRFQPPSFFERLLGHQILR